MSYWEEFKGSFNEWRPGIPSASFLGFLCGYILLMVVVTTPFIVIAVLVSDIK